MSEYLDGKVIHCPECVYYFAPVCTFYSQLPMSSRKGYCYHAVRGKYEGEIPTVERRTELTNREYINSLSNEELANYIYDVISVVGKDAKDSRQGVAEWLGRPKDGFYARAENCKVGGNFTECLKCGKCGRLFKNGYLV